MSRKLEAIIVVLRLEVGSSRGEERNAGEALWDQAITLAVVAFFNIRFSERSVWRELALTCARDISRSWVKK